MNRSFQVFCHWHLTIININLLLYIQCASKLFDFNQNILDFEKNQCK